MTYEDERTEAERIEDAAKQARAEFAWSIKISRLCDNTIERWATGQKDLTKKTTKADALIFIEQAEGHCEKWLSQRIESGEYGEAETKAAKDSIEATKAEALRQAEALEA